MLSGIGGCWGPWAWSGSAGPAAQSKVDTAIHTWLQDSTKVNNDREL